MRVRRTIDGQAKEVMAHVMEELKTPRETFVHVRGNFKNRGERVEPGVPALLPQPPQGEPVDRLAFARSLVSDDNPLTARVTANRIWQHYFGVGIVRTSDDFGLQGEWPSHPELLDWLALELVESGWDIKALHRLIVTSATYRQTSAATRDEYLRDPDNRLLARGPRFRLPAEQIRDSALSAAGLLNRKIGGPSVFPVQPPDIYEEKGQTMHHPKWQTTEGVDRYRRAMYIYWRRTVLYPSLAAFGAPTRETCTVQRPRTNTPLQALVLLNDPAYVEAARELAAIIIKHGDGATERIDYAFRRVLARPPSEQEASLYSDFLRRQRAHYTANAKDAKELVGQTDLHAAEHAAWTVLASVLLNLDEFVTKE
jgi:hypothetical protein